MIKILMKKQLKQLFSGFFVDRKTGKSKSKGAAVFGIVIYITLILGCMGSMFGSVAYSMCAQLCAVGLDWMYMAMMAMMSLAIGIFGSVFNTYASIYQAKDNDLMLSLPIPVRAILFSRLDRMTWFYIFLVGFAIELACLLAGFSGHSYDPPDICRSGTFVHTWLGSGEDRQ